jgi:hypothetical protein
MLKKGIWFVIIVEILLFAILGTDCLLEHKPIPWVIFIFTSLGSIGYFFLCDRIQSELIKNNIYRSAIVVFLIIWIIAISSNIFDSIFLNSSICTIWLAFGWIVGRKISNILPRS